MLSTTTWKPNTTYSLVISESKFFLLLQAFSSIEGTLCLISRKASFDSQSYLGLFPYEKIIINSPINPWKQLKQRLTFDTNQAAFPKYMGYISYEMGYYADPDTQFEPIISNYPLAYFQRSLVTIKYNHHTNLASIYVENPDCIHPYQNYLDYFKTPPLLESFLQKLSINKIITPSSIKLSYTHAISKTAYIKNIKKVYSYILDGDIFQANLSQKLYFKGKVSPFSIFFRLLDKNPTAFSAFYNLGNFSLISNSPERFIQLNQGFLETRPIKGTLRRNSENTLEELQKKLLNSEKDRAELMMICDLMRNDLGKISQINTVDVVYKVHLETYEHLIHMLSIIRSKPKPNLHPVELIQQIFPAGSITGCPKIRSMEIIREIEQTPRGIYTGSMGYFSHNGEFDFNVAIRTAVATENNLTLQVGGAITYDSIPEMEYEETLCKAQTFLDLVQ